MSGLDELLRDLAHDGARRLGGAERLDLRLHVQRTAEGFAVPSVGGTDTDSSEGDFVVKS